MAQGGRGKKRCHFPPEGDTIGNAITRKCKLGMLTYITMDISLCPPEWYQSPKFRVLAHALQNTPALQATRPQNTPALQATSFKVQFSS